RWIGHFLASLAETSEDTGMVDRIKPLISRLAMALVNRADEPVLGEKLRCSAYGADPQILHHVQRDNAAGIAAIAGAHLPVILGHGSRLLLIAAVRGKARAVAELLRQGVDANAT